RQGYRDAQDGRSDQPNRSTRFQSLLPGQFTAKITVPEAAAGTLPPVAEPPRPGPQPAGGRSQRVHATSIGTHVAKWDIDILLWYTPDIVRNMTGLESTATGLRGRTRR